MVSNCFLSIYVYLHIYAYLLLKIVGIAIGCVFPSEVLCSNSSTRPTLPSVFPGSLQTILVVSFLKGCPQVYTISINIPQEEVLEVQILYQVSSLLCLQMVCRYILQMRWMISLLGSLADVLLLFLLGSTCLQNDLAKMKTN